MNQLYAHLNRPYETFTRASALREVFGVPIVQKKINNAHVLLSCILVLSIQIGCSMRVVYAECMNGN